MSKAINNRYALLRDNANFEPCESWSCRDLLDNSQQVLQLYLVRTDASSTLLGQILNESIKAISKIANHSVIAIKDYGYDINEGAYFFVYAPVSGIPIEQYIKSAKPGIQWLLQVLTQLAEILDDIHAHSFAHGDLSIQEVYWRRDPNLGIELNRVGLSHVLRAYPNNWYTAGYEHRDTDEALARSYPKQQDHDRVPDFRRPVGRARATASHTGEHPSLRWWSTTGS